MKTKEQLLQQVFTSIQEYCDANHHFGFDAKNPTVRLMEPTFGAEEINAAVETLLSTQVTMGKKVRAFEQQYAEKFGHQYAVTSNSGSSANLLAFAALTNPVTRDRLQPGDEVIVPALSWATTIWPVIQCNLVPVVVDSDLNTFNFDLNKLEGAIGPKTRAIMLVHTYGNPCDMDGLMAIARKHNLMVIEDCCEAMGGTYDGKAVGRFGILGSLSFYFSHHITTLEGGVSVTDDFELTELLRILRAHGWSRQADSHQKYIDKYPQIDPRFIFVNLGYNLRLTEVQAAIGMKQLPKLEKFVAARREVAAFLLQNLRKYSEFFHFQTETPKAKHVWFGFPIIVKKTAPFTVKQITTYLQQHAIETRPIIAGNMARHPGLQMFPHRIGGDLQVADTVMQQGFGVADHHIVDHAARQYMVDVIDNFMQQYVFKKNNSVEITA